MLFYFFHASPHSGSVVNTCTVSSALPTLHTPVFLPSMEQDDVSYSLLCFLGHAIPLTKVLVAPPYVCCYSLIPPFPPPSLMSMLYFGLCCSCTFAKLLPPYVCGEKAFISSRTSPPRSSLSSSSPSMYTWAVAAPLCIFPGDKTRRSHAPAPPVILMQRHFFARARIP